MTQEGGIDAKVPFFQQPTSACPEALGIGAANVEDTRKRGHYESSACSMPNTIGTVPTREKRSADLALILPAFTTGLLLNYQGFMELFYSNRKS